MTTDMEILPIFAGFTSQYEYSGGVFDSDIPSEKRDWSSSSPQPQLLEAHFDGVYLVTRITARQISTDQTTEGFRWGFWARDGSGNLGPFPVDGIHDVNVGRSATDYGYSVDNDAELYPLHDGWTLKRKEVGPMDVTLDHPYEAMAMQLRLEGHGWFRCVDIRFYGRLIRPLGEAGILYFRPRREFEYPIIRNIR